MVTRVILGYTPMPMSLNIKNVTRWRPLWPMLDNVNRCPRLSLGNSSAQYSVADPQIRKSWDKTWKYLTNLGWQCWIPWLTLYSSAKHRSHWLASTAIGDIYGSWGNTIWCLDGQVGIYYRCSRVLNGKAGIGYICIGITVFQIFVYRISKIFI